MPFLRPTASQRLLIALGLYLSAAAAAGVAWMHAASLGGAAFICGSAEAHCWACYAAPLLASLGVWVLAAPEAKPALARRP